MASCERQAGPSLRPFLPWWLDPFWGFGVFMTGVWAWSWFLPESLYLDAWHTPKFLTLETFGVGLLLIVSYLAGVPVGRVLVHGLETRQHGDPREDAGVEGLLLKAFYGGLVLTLVGYGAWFGLAVARGFSIQHLVGLLMGQPGLFTAVKAQYFATVPGLTTLTQLGPPTVLLGLLLKERHKLGWPIMAVAMLALLRALINSERLALMEVVVPAAVLMLGLQAFKGAFSSARARLALSLAPLAAPPLMIGLFAAFEFNRSWVSYYMHQGGALWEFASYRLAGYYATSINNGAMLLADSQHALPLPYFTLRWLWEFPLLDRVLAYEAWTGVSLGAWFSGLLAYEGNPEFNNPCGLVLPVLDYGLFGGMLFWLAAGVAVGMIYAWYRRGRLVGLLCYPLVYLGLLEVPRFLMWFDGRMLPQWAMLLGVVLLLAMWRARGATAAEPQEATA